MNKRNFGFSALTAAGLLASPLLMGAALAQTSTTAPTTTAAPAKPAAAKVSPMIMHVNEHLASLKKSLAITPAEENNWEGFAQVMRDNATGLAAQYKTRADAVDTMNAVQNMESYTSIASTQADDMTRLSAAFQTLYTSLTPAQQQKADQIFRTEAKSMHAKHAHG
jgi:hypothetical protein